MEIGHNHLSADEKQRNQKFLRSLTSYREELKKMGSARANIRHIYKENSVFNIDKRAYAYAEKLRNGDTDKLLAELRMQLWVASMVAPEIASQFDMFDEVKISEEESAYAKGYSAGARREENSNPYDGPLGQSWQDGFNAGTEFVNAELNEAINGEDNTEGDDQDEEKEAETPAEVENSTDDEKADEAADDDDNVVQMKQEAY